MWLKDTSLKNVVSICSSTRSSAILILGADVDIVFPKLTGSSEQQTEETDESFSWAGKFDEIWTVDEEPETFKALFSPERLKVTMTHGSVLIFLGVNMEVGLQLKSKKTISITACRLASSELA